MHTIDTSSQLLIMALYKALVVGHLDVFSSWKALFITVWYKEGCDDVVLRQIEYALVIVKTLNFFVIQKVIV